MAMSWGVIPDLAAKPCHGASLVDDLKRDYWGYSPNHYWALDMV
jgi:pullulanase/glycogen debranching enzyme